MIQIPHGHIPAPLIIKLYQYLLIPAGKKRENDFYSCPECGRPSFFKITKWCDICDEEIQDEEKYAEYYERWQSRERENRRRQKFKKIEHVLLPILLIFGLVRYNRSVKRKIGYDFPETDEYNPYYDNFQTAIDDFMEVSL